jgi:hypothetical protein
VTLSKPLSPQLQPFGKSDDDFGELTFEVEQFSALSARRGWSAWRPWTVRVEAADGPRVACSSHVRRVLVRLCLRFGLAFGFCCNWFANGLSFNSGRSGTQADGPPGLRGRSVFLGSLLLVLCALSDGPRHRARQSVVLARTVRGSRPDCPRGQCGRSAPPGRTVRRSLCALLLGSIPPFFSCASACASRYRS